MGEQLHAFLSGARVGTFMRQGDDRATFVYDGAASATPVSLSLPRGKAVGDERPFNYLDNLLPESDDTRERLARVAGVSSGIFDLLRVLGEDVAGALSLSPDPELPRRMPAPLIEASEDDIAFRIATLRRDPSAPPPAESRPRWSLAGQQAKFSLARVGDRWFWSTYEQPSTHIFKPASAATSGVEFAEHACLRLARELGVQASRSEVVEFRGQQAFAVERWDRHDGVRLHAEDLVQSLGLPPYDKYSVPAVDAVNLLRPYGQEWAFVRQLVFNTAIGNSDAHAKNYSVLLAGDEVRLAPLYDAIPVFLWPHVDQRVVMYINRKVRLQDIRESDWIAFAAEAGLDPDQMMETVRTLYTGVAAGLPDALLAAGASAAAVSRANEHARTLPQLWAGRP